MINFITRMICGLLYMGVAWFALYKGGVPPIVILLALCYIVGYDSGERHLFKERYEDVDKI